MESGFSLHLQGNKIQGNLSIEATATPLITGDGSLELAGSIYTDVIKEYNTQTLGILIRDVYFKKDSVYIPWTAPSIGWTSGGLIIDSGLTIRNTSGATGLSSGGGITDYGGLAVVKNSFFGGTMDLTGHKIINLDYCADPLDAANKSYVDSVSWRLHGNFTTGQVLVAETIGTAIRGYNAFTFDGETLLLSPGTRIEIQSTFGNSFTSLGGGSFGGVVNVNQNVVTGLDDPVGPLDAVNLRFLKKYLYDCDTTADSTFEQEVSLEYSPEIPLDYSNLLVESASSIFFEEYIYSTDYIGGKSVYSITGFYNGFGWSLHTNQVGIGNNKLGWSITPGGQVQYTNKISSLPKVYTKHRRILNIDPESTDTRISTMSPQVVPTILFTFPNGVVAYSLIVIIGTTCFMINGVFTGINWVLNRKVIGSPLNVQFYTTNSREFQYTTPNASGIVYIHISNSFKDVTFLPNSRGSVVPAPYPLDVSFDQSLYQNFYTQIYTNSGNLYTIIGVYTGMRWEINTTFIGTLPSGVTFSIIGNSLYYSSTRSLNFSIGELGISLPSFKNAICVKRGGTGTNEHLPGGVLVGNGQHFVKTFHDLYYNETIGTLKTKNIDLTGYLRQNGETFSGTTATLGNLITSPTTLLTNVPGDIQLQVFQRNNASVNTSALYTLTILQGDLIDTRVIGSGGSVFYYSTSGELQYTSDDSPGFIDNTAKFNVLGIF